jgi:hypothetical protein
VPKSLFKPDLTSDFLKNQKEVLFSKKLKFIPPSDYNFFIYEKGKKQSGENQETIF